MNRHQRHWLDEYTNAVYAAVAELREYVETKADWVCPGCGNIVGPPPGGFMHEKTCDLGRDENGAWRYWSMTGSPPDYGSWGEEFTEKTVAA